MLDLFSGSGTTGPAAQRVGRRYIGVDINAEYLDLSPSHPKWLQAPRSTLEPSMTPHYSEERVTSTTPKRWRCSPS